jgi:hypothetical protein
MKRYTDDAYDEERCFTAAQLRELGCEIPSSIPDPAWVPKYAVKVTPKESTMVDGTFRIKMSVEFRAPFTWIELELSPDPRVVTRQSGVP